MGSEDRTDELTRRFFEQADSAVPELLRDVQERGTPIVESVGGAFTTLEFLLGGLFAQRASTRMLWCDGILPTAARAGDPIAVDAIVWCGSGHGGMWIVPALLEFRRRSGSRTDELVMGLGDGRLGGLLDHESAGRRSYAHRSIDRWSEVFVLRRPEPPAPPDVGPVLARLRACARSDPPRTIVGPDGRPRTLREAEEFVRARAREGLGVRLEESWLDGAIAVRLF